MRYTTAYVKQLENRKGKPWQARLKYKENGKWKEISKMLPEAKGKREAQRMANEWMSEQNKLAENSLTISYDKTVEETVREYLNRQLETGVLEKSTYLTEIKNMERNTFPYIGAIGFTTLDRITIDGWLTKLYNKGFKSGTIRISYTTVAKVYKFYYQVGDILKNPFDGVKAPKVSDNRKSHLTQEEMIDVVKCAEDFFYKNPYSAKAQKTYLIVLLAFYSGIRRGEICGLRWRNFDLEHNILSIDTAIGRGYNGAYSKGPKNKSSNRYFMIVPQLAEALKKIKEIVKPEPNWFIVGKREDFITPERCSQLFDDFVKEYDLKDAYDKKLTLHGLRHNLGALSIKGGVDVASLSKMMGHSKISTTLDTYGDAMKDAMAIANEKLAKQFQREIEMEVKENE